ncbi:MAG: hypothetical protein KDE23_15000 [Caldilinea sp.]|nr:hypothetical protein [Caldilinea sp.]
MTGIATFGYDDAEQRIVVEQRFSEAQDMMRHGLWNLTQACGKFAEIRDRLAHNKAGGFEGWVASKGLARASVYRLIGLHAGFGNCVNLTQLDIDKSAAYLLASASTPDQARAEAVQLAEAGERITVARAKVIIQQAQPAPADITAALENWLATFTSDRQRELALQDVCMNGADLYAALRARLPQSATRNDVRRAARALLPAAALKSAANGVNGHGPEPVYIAPHAARRATPAAVRTKSPATKTAPDLSPEELRRSLIELLTLPATATNADILAAVGTLQAAFEVNHDL